MTPSNMHGRSIDCLSPKDQQAVRRFTSGFESAVTSAERPSMGANRERKGPK
jgi:hypothetical protein